MAARRAIRFVLLLPAARQRIDVATSLRRFSSIVVPTPEEAAAAAAVVPRDETATMRRRSFSITAPSAEEAAAAATGGGEVGEAAFEDLPLPPPPSLFIAHMDDVFELVYPSQSACEIPPKPLCYDLSAPADGAVVALSDGSSITRCVTLPMRDLGFFMETDGIPLPLARATRSIDGGLLQFGIYPKLSFAWYMAFRYEGTQPLIDTLRCFDLHCHKSSGMGLLQYGPNISKGAVFEGPITPEMLSDLKLRIATHYDVGDVLGSGAESIVWKAKSKHENYHIALKRLKMQHIVKESSETFLGKTLRDDLIRRLIGAWNEESDKGIIETWIALDYQPMTLKEFVEMRPKFCLKTRLRILLQLFNSVQVLHDNLYAHRDLNLQNVLLNGDIVSLGDLGYVEKIVNGRFDIMDKGSAKSGSWVAPELRGGKGMPTLKAEVYPLSLIMLFLLCEKLEGSVPQNFRLLDKVLRAESTKGRLDKWNDCKLAKVFRGNRELLLRGLSRNPADRPTIKELIAWIESLLAYLEDKE